MMEENQQNIVNENDAKEEKKKKIIITVIVAVVIIGGLIVTGFKLGWFGTPASRPAGEQTSEKAENIDDQMYIPTFMLFGTTEQLQETAVLVQQLKEKYPDINYDIRNIDEHPEDAENFGVKDQIPAVIMLDDKNGICGYAFKSTDINEYEKCIKIALN